MDIRSNLALNSALLNDTKAAVNGAKNQAAVAGSAGSVETAPAVTSIQEETSSIKNNNDLFGYLKKSEKALAKIDSLVKESGDIASVSDAVAEIMATTTYKEKPIFGSFLQGRDGSSLDLKSELESLLAQNDRDGFMNVVANQSEITSALLDGVKKELLGSSNSLDRHISTDIETIKRDIESMAPLGDVNSPDLLKSKLKALLG